MNNDLIMARRIQKMAIALVIASGILILSVGGLVISLYLKITQ